ncbi:MAG: hypothetical protein EAZ95_20230 [Bacteroidetes bacterium]|nr:MAG: hypothetical protein EAZ95_20230 [Bacteroidota bacterium]
MIEFPFYLTEDELIIVEVTLNVYYKTYLALDTGCTHTVIHSDYAESLGFKLRKAPKVNIFTGSREERAKEIIIDFVEALNHSVENLSVYAFDVYLISDKYVGYLGLDFFKGKKLSIDFEKEVIYLE